MSGQATVIGFCGPPGSIALPAGLRWLRMAIRLALCVLCALTLGTAWAQSGGGGNANGGAMLSATQPIPAGTAAAAGATPSAGAAAAAHPTLPQPLLKPASPPHRRRASTHSRPRHRRRPHPAAHANAPSTAWTRAAGSGRQWIRSSLTPPARMRSTRLRAALRPRCFQRPWRNSGRR